MADAVVLPSASAGASSSTPRADEHHRTGEEADLSADATADFPSKTPPTSPHSSRGSSERSPSVTPSQIGRGMQSMARTPGNRARRRLLPPEVSDMKSLHVDVPPTGSVDVLKILDAVPFTPSQGVRTPSPRNMDKTRTVDHSESGPSRLSVMENRDSHEPSPPFSPSSRFDLHGMAQYGMASSPPFSPTYGAHYAQAGMMPEAHMAAAMSGQMHGQLLHQMYFGGYSGSPPSPSAAGASWHGATSPVEYGPPSPTSYMQMPAAVYAQQMPPMYVAQQMAPQPLPSVYAAALPHNMYPTDYSMAQNYAVPVTGVPVTVSTHPMLVNQAQHRVQPGPPAGASARRSHSASRFRAGSGGQPNASRAQNANAAAQLQTYAMAQARAQNLRQNAPRSPDSSPNSSSNGSPNASQSGQGGDSSKPRMNARQRRTERRRRERDIKAITDHLKDLGESGGDLTGEDRRLFDFQLSEVQTLMNQVQKQQQDTGEGVLIEYHLRKLRDLLKMEETPDADMTLSNESSPNNTTMGSVDHASPPGQSCLSPDRASGVIDDLDSKFKESIDLSATSSKVPPAEPEKGSAALDEGSPTHPTTPQTQAHPPLQQRA